MERLTSSLQGNLLVLLCWSKKNFQLVRNSVDVNLFSTDIYRNVVSRVYAYIDQFKKPPKDHLPDLLEDELSGKNGELYKQLIVGIRNERHTINEDYVINQLESFIRVQNLKLGIIKASDALNVGDVESAEVALQQSLKERLTLFNPGTTLTQALEHLRKHEGKLRESLPLGIKELDNAGVGPARKELHALIGPKKAGKTWWLIHVGKRSLLWGWRVCVISLEVSEILYATRFLQSLYSLTLGEARRVQVTVFKRDELGRVASFERESIISKSLSTPEGRAAAKKGLNRFSANLRIKEFPTRSLTMPGLRAYLDTLERLENFVPDMLIVDYPGIMKIDQDAYRLGLMQVSADLRGLAVERNMAVVVVQQSNREGARSGTVSGVHAAEDFSINMTADVVLTYSQTPAEYQLGLARLGVDASRISRQHLAAMITQSYDLGQFCLDSAPIMQSYWDVVSELSGQENPEEEDQ